MKVLYVLNIPQWKNTLISISCDVLLCLYSMASVQNSLSDSHGSPGRAGSLNAPTPMEPSTKAPVQRDTTPERPISMPDKSIKLSPPCRDRSSDRRSQSSSMSSRSSQSRYVKANTV